MNDPGRQDLFADLMNRHQSELYAYIYAVVRNREDTDDLYQSVCLVLWSKFESFRPGSNFFAWAPNGKEQSRRFRKAEAIADLCYREADGYSHGNPC
jgi:RNA polymerase sigma factor (sigma-70 family)